MKKIIRKIGIVLFFFLFFFSFSNLEVIGQVFNADDLKGLKGVYVGIGKFPPDLAKYLDEAQIKKDIESKLRTAEIDVVSESEASRGDIGILYFYLLYRIQSGTIYYDIKLQFLQKAIIFPSEQKSNATTWNKSGMGSVSTKNTNILRNSIKGALDSFIKDYLSVNPKQ
jgi:hypothetical protein